MKSRVCLRRRAQQCVEPTGLYRHSNRYLVWQETVVSDEVGCASATQRLTLVVGRRIDMYHFELSVSNNKEDEMNTNRSLLIVLTRCLMVLALSLVLTVAPSVTQAAANKIYYTTNDDYSVKRANTDGTNVEILHTSATGTPSGIIIDPDNNKIYFTDNHSTVAKIQRMNLDGTGLEDVLTGVQAISIALDRYGGKIYYTTEAGAGTDYSVKRANTDGTAVETLHTSATGTPEGIALDTRNGKVYFTDNHASVEKIQRMNLDGTGLEDVLTGVQAISIVLDVDGGKMYYTTNDDWSVKRANTDGTNVETLYTSATGTPRGITLDLDSGKIYFTDIHSSMEKIQRMNLDGTGLEDILTGVSALKITTEPPVPTALIVNCFSAHNRASIAAWLPTLIIVLGLSGLSWRKAMHKNK
jgi:streptogramin lyase